MASAIMPVGSPMNLPIRAEEVRTTEGNERPAIFTEDATANLVWNDYLRAKAYVESENTAWQEQEAHAAAMQRVMNVGMTDILGGLDG
jgi:hypothetical protein